MALSSWILALYSLFLITLSISRPVGFVVRHGLFYLKVHHITAFACHVVLFWWWLGQKDRDRAPRHRLLLAGFASFLFGSLIEFIQLYVSHRSGRAADLIQNAAGVLIGWAVILAWQAIASRPWLRRRGRLQAAKTDP